MSNQTLCILREKSRNVLTSQRVQGIAEHFKASLDI